LINVKKNKCMKKKKLETLIIIFLFVFMSMASKEVEAKEKKENKPAAIVEVKKETKNPTIKYNFADTVAMLESSGKLDTINTLGYIGLYQFGEKALKDLNVSKKKLLKMNKKEQTELFWKFVKLNKKYLTSKMGMDWVDLMEVYGYTNFQLIYACHRHGAGNVAVFFNGGKEHRDGNGKPISQVKELFLIR